jgi:hypothetical protein
LSPPPPLASPEQFPPLGRLATMVCLSATAPGPPPLKMPPPPPAPALLPERVTVTPPLLKIPPPKEAALLPERVLPVTVSVPRLEMPPPPAAPALFVSSRCVPGRSGSGPAAGAGDACPAVSEASEAVALH